MPTSDLEKHGTIQSQVFGSKNLTGKHGERPHRERPNRLGATQPTQPPKIGGMRVL